MLEFQEKINSKVGFGSKNFVPTRMKEVLSSPWYQLIFKLQSTIVYATYDFFKLRGYEPVVLPVTTGSVTSPMGLGSDSLPVKVKLFNELTYLADSMQFHLEYLLRISRKGVFYIMPTFRGEDSDSRHLNQFSHIEAEIKGDLNDVLLLIDEYIYFLLSTVLKEHEKDLAMQIGSFEHLTSALARKDNMFKRVTFSEAMDILGKESKQFFNYMDSTILGLSNDGEKELIKRIGQEVCLTHLPKIGVPFYQDNDSDNIHALCADYLAGIGEFIGCGQRHFGYHGTIEAMRERQIDPGEYEWYLQMKKEYPEKTSGFGLGLERFLLWILNHKDVRDVPLISRLKGHPCNP